TTTKGVEGAAKGVTSTVGNLAGGATPTVGGIVGAAGHGLGDTINSTTGTKQVGDLLKSVTDGVDDAGRQTGKGMENAGQCKSS
ncbi:hypothetical protein EJ03DRAFT_116054, partial [Teratosphaeria nubilosa]